MVKRIKICLSLWLSNLKTNSFNSWLILVITFVLFGSLFTYTYAYFHDDAESRTSNFRAMQIGDVLNIIPGVAQAAYATEGAETHSVAGYDENNDLFLDFGDVLEGTYGGFGNSLQLTNISSNTLTVSWYLEGEIASLMPGMEGSFNLLPEGGGTKTTTTMGSTYSTSEKVYGTLSNSQPEFSNPFVLNLSVHPELGTTPKNYEGYLVIKVDGDFLMAKIPAKVSVIGDQSTFDKSISVVTQNDVNASSDSIVQEAITADNALASKDESTNQTTYSGP